MTAIKVAFSPSCFSWNGTGHIPPFDEHRELFVTQKQPYCICTEGFLGTRVTFGARSNILFWAHHVVNKLKIVVMSDGYGVLRVFLFEPAK